jgi:hypothetical protein
MGLIYVEIRVERVHKICREDELDGLDYWAISRLY